MAASVELKKVSGYNKQSDGLLGSKPKTRNIGDVVLVSAGADNMYNKRNELTAVLIELGKLRQGANLSNHDSETYEIMGD